MVGDKKKPKKVKRFTGDLITAAVARLYGLKPTRVFDGEQYKMYRKGFDKKSEANEEAIWIRSSNFKVRVLYQEGHKNIKGYYLYIRKK